VARRGSLAVSGSGRRFLLPVIGRHVAVEFLRAFALTVLAFLAIYVLADFFDRFDSFLQHDARAGTIIRLFLYRIPLIITQVTPVAVLAGGLVGLGLLARQNEFVAMRACGISIWQIILPLSLVAMVISVLVFAWNETVVPTSARRWHQIWNEEIKGRQTSTVFTGREVWYHGGAGFYDVDRVAPRRQQLIGLTVYQLGTDFRPAAGQTIYVPVYSHVHTSSDARPFDLAVTLSVRNTDRARLLLLQGHCHRLQELRLSRLRRLLLRASRAHSWPGTAACDVPHAGRRAVSPLTQGAGKQSSIQLPRHGRESASVVEAVRRRSPLRNARSK